MAGTAVAGTTVWESTTSQDFNAGELEGVVVVAPGRVRLGPTLEKFELEEGAVWCLHNVPGRGLFVGTARGAAVYVLVGSKLKNVLKAEEELIISCMTSDGEGNVYAACVPGGKIYKIPPEGEPEIIRLPDPYIWALTLDPLGHLLAATGPKGKLYRVERGGGWVKEVFASDGEKNLVSLAVGRKGEIYCGSAENGILYRVSPDGKVEAVHDFKEMEIRSLVLSEGNLYVGANTPKKGFDQVSFAGSLSGTLSSESWGSGNRQDVMKKILGASVYRIDPEGRVAERARFEKTYLLGLGLGSQGEIFVATGDSGRVFSVDRDRRVATLIDLDEERVLAFCMADGFPAAAGSGAPAALYVVREAKGPRGHYLSKIHDAGFPAVWGLATWLGKGKVTLSFRSGNTEKPDRTWSPWSVPAVAPGHPVPAPGGRYLQYRIDFTQDRASEVDTVRVSYVVQNQRPVIKELKLGEDAGAETYALFRAKRLTEVKLVVKAEDPNGDALVFRFFYRIEGEEGWIPMSADPLEKPEYTWKTEDLPDGLYQVRVVVSDEIANPDPLSEERISRTVPVDNHRPAFENLTAEGGKAPVLSGTATDSGSVITRVEYRVDSGIWFPVAPSDRVFDSRRESFTFSVPDLASGVHRVWIRAWDRAGNAGVEVRDVRVP